MSQSLDSDNRLQGYAIKRKGTTAGKKRHKGRQENAQRQDMKGTNEASKEGLKGRPGNLKRWAGGQGMTQKQERKGTKAGIREDIKAGKKGRQGMGTKA